VKRDGANARIFSARKNSCPENIFLVGRQMKNKPGLPRFARNDSICYTVSENLQNEALNKAPQGDRMEPTWIFRENNIFPQIIFTGPACLVMPHDLSCRKRQAA